MRVAVVVHGRFYAFDLVEALIARGHDVTLFTNYPRWVVRRFGLPEDKVRSFWLHGLLTKAADLLDPRQRFSVDRWLHPGFGAWARDQLLREGHWDAIHTFSGISEEILRSEVLNGCCQLVRASAHIETQARILREEERRVGTRLDRPTRWMIERELREYELAPSIVVLSQFAWQSFVDEGVSEQKLRLMPLGSDLDGFRPSDTLVRERVRRIRAGEPLTIVYAGNISFQKGIFDTAEIIRQVSGNGFHFRLAGVVMSEAKEIVKGLSGAATFLGKLPQDELPGFYASGDIFLFPTIQDGFAVVLAQAQSSALPVISSGNCSAGELVRPGHGWVLPIRSPERFAEKLLWCNAHREELAEMVESLHRSTESRDYSDVAADFERICAENQAFALTNGKSQRSAAARSALKVAVVVHGRFHAFDLARALIARGLDVTVLTSYPYWVAARWGIPSRRLRTFPLHGVLGRVGGRIRYRFPWADEAFLHDLFSRWAVRQLRREPWDVIYSFSGISESIEREPALAGALRMVVRGSAHIRRQAEILLREEERVCQRLDRPSQWMIEREEREYQMADRIVVLSTFAYESFREQGIPESKLSILPLGSESRAFRPHADLIEARRSRILSGGPLTIVYAGNISFQKGAFDMAEIIRQASGRTFRFRLAGVVMPEARKIAEELRTKAEFLGRLPQADLPGFYATGDIFLFPTLQDGFAVVLAQASAAGLPILTTSNCCGPDLVHEGQTGWVLPIRDPGAFLERLTWCETHRRELADMVTATYDEFRTRDWSDVAADFESLCRTEIAVRARQHTRGGLQPNQLLEEVRNQS